MRVVIGEDEPLLREGIRAVLVRAGMQVVAAVANAEQLLEQVRAHRPDLLITDIRMPPGRRDDGLEVALRVRQELSGMPVMLLSQHTSRRYVRELLASGPGAVGYLLKQRVADTERFVADLRRVAAGGTVLDPEIASVMVARATRSAEPLAGLTPRQREVLGLIAEGRTNAGIAQRLGITEKAVTRHASTIYVGLGLEPGADDHRRVLAVLWYLEGTAGEPSRGTGV